jgi:hypothetical protein
MKGMKEERNMKYRVIGLVMLVGIGVFGIGGACDSVTNVTEGVCGDCGTIANGDATISGDARVDGLFKAVGTLGSATASVQADFRANLEALAETFGATCTTDDTCGTLSIGDLEAQVKASIEGELTANVSGGLRINYEAPKCSASVNVAVEAQAQCEAKADCDVSAECSGGEVAVTCEGSCSGGCSGGCTGTCSVKVDAACSGTCKGTCDMTATPGACEGTCNGTCSGTCTLQDAEGNCKGECDGDCTGSCEPPSAGMTCSGTCHGSCEAEATAACEGECHGSCDAECSGGCEGTATPPSCSASGSCEASADCQASASAQASASLECTPPSIAIDFDFNADVTADAKASFLAKMSELKVRMVAIVQGMFKLRALVDVNYAAEIGITSPVDAITAQLEVLVSADFSSFNIPVGLLPCAIPALQESITTIGSVVTDTSATVSAQLDFFAIIGG